MKRSDINAIIREAERFISSCGFLLPPAAAWTPAEWERRGSAADLVKQAGIGWDITDYGKGEFDQCGLVLFTLRNGLPPGSAVTGLPYAEKILISGDNQICLTHYHKEKTEDLIVRGGSPLAVRLHTLDEAGNLDLDSPVEVQMDGILCRVAAGEAVIIEPGASITLFPGQAHSFWGHGGPCLVGEVSSVNDDKTDNYFFEPTARFPRIEEDEPPYRLIVADYLP